MTHNVLESYVAEYFLFYFIFPLNLHYFCIFTNLITQTNKIICIILNITELSTFPIFQDFIFFLSNNILKIALFDVACLAFKSLSCKSLYNNYYIFTYIIIY